MMLCAEVYRGSLRHVSCSFQVWHFKRSVQLSACPFDLNQLLDGHCIDLLTKKYVPTAGYPCLEVCSVLGHFSFTFGGEFVASLFVEGRE